MDTDELRDTFLIDDLFKAGSIELLYCETERTVVGAAIPLDVPLALEAGEEMACESFCDRRELGILNLGASGTVVVDGQVYELEYLDCLYVGRGAKEILFASSSSENPARFYLASYPAHRDYPTTLAKKSEATEIELGSQKDANERTIFQYIHEGGVQSCQLVMGFTRLKEGSVWNTMPPHTHERRTEVYLYFDVDEDSTVFHMMGPGNETRHIAVQNLQAVVSPMWSIHSGCGTRNYSFVWCMGGENQTFSDMDGIAIEDIR